MSKNYRNKEACLKEAERLGIEGAESMSWPQLQKAVSDALKLEELGVDNQAAPVHQKTHVQANSRKQKPKALSPEQAAAMPYMDKTVVISPELAPERYRLVKYDEELGPDYDVVERKFDMNRETDEVFDISGELGDRNRVDQYHDYLTGTYRLKKRSDRKVTGLASVPKENSGMYERWQDPVTVVTWKGRAGYLWKHMFLPNVRDLLMQSGYYNEYKHLFKDEPNVWYAAGKQLVCDPHLVHQVLKEIEEKEQRKKAVDRSLGWSWD